jgi:c(7)-type cytochrome triheme protein
MKGRVLAVLAVGLFCAATAWGKVGGGDITFSMTGAADVTYSHEFHVMKAGLKCTDCHYKVFDTHVARKKMTMADMEKGLYCGACHDGQRAFTVKGNCDKCHK